MAPQFVSPRHDIHISEALFLPCGDRNENLPHNVTDELVFRKFPVDNGRQVRLNTHRVLQV